MMTREANLLADKAQWCVDVVNLRFVQVFFVGAVTRHAIDFEERGVGCFVDEIGNVVVAFQAVLAGFERFAGTLSEEHEPYQTKANTK